MDIFSRNCAAALEEKVQYKLWSHAVLALLATNPDNILMKIQVNKNEKSNLLQKCWGDAKAMG